MPKLKTHSGCKKRFRTTAKGKIIRPYAGKRHGMRKRSKDMKREARGTTVMDHCDAKIIIKNYIPYGLK
jgi:large subunit ribosomal protein L35